MDVDNIDSGYFFCPYEPLTSGDPVLTEADIASGMPSGISGPVTLDPNAFVTRPGILTRYGRRILEEGAVHYGGFAPEEYKLDENVHWQSEGF